MTWNLDKRQLSTTFFHIHCFYGVSVSLSDLLRSQENSRLTSVVYLKFVGPRFTFDHTSSLEVMSKRLYTDFLVFLFM